MEKKNFGYIVVVLALFGGFYFLGKKTKSSVTPEDVGTISDEAAAGKTTPETVTANHSAKKPLIGFVSPKAKPVIPYLNQKPLVSLHGGELYHQLFDGKSLTNLDATTLQQVTSLFAKPYPVTQAQYQTVTVDRLGILKALEQQAPLKRGPSSTVSPQLVSFYKNVLDSNDENWLVKRQAFKNVKASLTTAEREAYYRHLDSRVVALASASEAEILTEVLREKK